MLLVFASKNAHKLQEIQNMLPSDIHLKLPSDFGIEEDIPETADTFDGNALQKAEYLYARCAENCFADDSGLETEALNGAPGVYSARYAGESKNDAENIQLLLKNLEGRENRRAAFKTVICLLLNGQVQYFEGTIQGHIISEPRGSNGFGYDPIFVPEGHDRTFAEMSSEEKNSMSHRKKAVAQMAKFLETVRRS